MSRSVWHKLRETKQVALDGLQLSDVLGGLQPSRKPVPGRMVWSHQSPQPVKDDHHSQNGHHEKRPQEQPGSQSQNGNGDRP